VSKAVKALVGAGVGLLLVVGITFYGGRGSAVSGSAPQASMPLNLGFEGDYVAWEGDTERMVAPGWSLWSTTNWPDESGQIALPRAEDEDSSCLEGDKAQLVRSDYYKTFDACLYQQIDGLSVGDFVRFSVSAKVISSLGAWDWQTRVGIDPHGGTDPRDIQFELYPQYWDPYAAGSEQWQELSVLTHALSETVTLYACAHPRWAVDEHFSVYWDQASLYSATPTYAYLPVVQRQIFVPRPGTLQNADLELNWGALEGYQPYPGYENTISTAPYWLPFWNDDYNPATGENKQPEYGRPRDAPHRIHTGEAAQQYGLSGWGGFEGGVYQVITGAIPGATYEFSMWGLGWSSTDPWPEDYSNVREGLNFKVGIDPTGGESYTSADVVWSELYDPYDAWHRFVVTATVPSETDGRISVWAYAHPAAYWIQFNQVFWDTGSLSVVGTP
jgi:hypothetical protein